MNTIRTAGTLTLGAALLGSCTERSIPTASRAVASETAAPLTSVATDSLGDVKNKYPAYVDVTRASVTRKGRSFIFTVDVAHVRGRRTEARPDGEEGVGSGPSSWSCRG